MRCRLILFIFVLYLKNSVHASSVLSLIGVPQTMVHLYSPRKDFTCFDGTLTIPYDWVNDDYCDCPDGSDEPSTSACPNSVFHCVNSGYYPLKLPSSMVNDGICDCCDGSDEYLKIVNCSNTCLMLNALAIAEDQERIELINLGSLIRQEMTVRGKEIKLEQEARLVELEVTLKEAKKRKREIEKIKNIWEEKQKKLIELSITDEEEVRSYKEELEETKSSLEQAKDIFNEIDSNKDSFLEVNEILIKLKSQDIFEPKMKSSLEVEVMHIMNTKSKLTFDDFLEIFWSRLKTLLNMNKSTSCIASRVDTKIINNEPVLDDCENNNDEVHYETKYDEETKRIINKTIMAREAYEKCDKNLIDIESKITRLEMSLQVDYGSEDEFLPLKGECFSFSSPSYNYTLCPFDQIFQTGKNGGCQIKLGLWKNWEKPSNYTTMIYDEGEECWNGPKRSAIIHISCGLKNELYSADEPDKCVYVLNFRTPAACNNDNLMKEMQSVVHDEL